jgi:hypothetical protein
VRDYRMLLQQNLMLRANASGTLRALLVGILKDPGMLVYLDNGENIKSHPNENFGRELLELFSMGVGNYTERDVREAARAFTGWTNDVLTFKFDESQHDFGEKTFLARTGPLNGETSSTRSSHNRSRRIRRREALSLLRARGRLQRDCASWDGRSGRVDIRFKPLMRRMLLSRDFYSSASVATQVKSPVHLVVSTYKKMGLHEVPTIPDFGRMTGSLGQTLFEPPNVAGWAGGRTWITPATLLQRGNLFRDVMFPDVKSFRPPDRAMSATDTRVGERLAQGMNITEATREGDAESNKMVDRDEDYNTRYGGYAGNLLAFKRTKLIPEADGRHRPDRDDHCGRRRYGRQGRRSLHCRFLSVPLADKDRALLVGLPARQARIVECAAGRHAGVVASRVAVPGAEHA